MRNRQRFTPRKRNRDRYRPDFARYEQLKAQWVADNPTASHEQYQSAMREIAEKCRI